MSLGHQGTDTAGIRFDYPNKKLFLLSGAGLKLGHTGGDEFQILRDDEHWIAAVNVADGVAVNAIVIEKQSGNAVWTKASGLFMLSGQSVFLTCK